MSIISTRILIPIIMVAGRYCPLRLLVSFSPTTRHGLDIGGR
jgi:hypothetical protein